MEGDRAVRHLQSDFGESLLVEIAGRRLSRAGLIAAEDQASAGTYGVDRHTTTDVPYGSSVGGGSTWTAGNQTLTSGSGRYWGLESRQENNVYYGWIKYDMSNEGKTLNFIDAAFSPTPGAARSGRAA
ncbi:MAG: hypothetical protein ACKO1M_07500 [Planctomycetota bacterium]